jgi:galactokinase/mevalonate kinase-like predicted kinase
MQSQKSIKVTAPFRVDIGGGVTDIPLFSQTVGPAISNISIDVFSDSAHTKQCSTDVAVNFNGLGTSRLFVNGVLQSLDLVEADELVLIKSAVNTFVTQTTPGVDIRISSNLPTGTGLGGSAVLTLSLFTALTALTTGVQDIPRESLCEIVKKAHSFETIQLGIAGGFQDYIGAGFGGSNYIDFPSLYDTDLINSTELGRLLPEHSVRFLNNNSVIVIQKTGNAGSDSIVNDQIANFTKSPAIMSNLLVQIKQYNQQIDQMLHSTDSTEWTWQTIGNAVNESWEIQKQLSNLVGGGLIRTIESEIKSKVLGLRGPGAGANSLFIITRDSERKNILTHLKKYADDVEILFPKVNNLGVRIVND